MQPVTVFKNYLSVSLLLCWVALGEPVFGHESGHMRRALPNAPRGYAPAAVQCPNTRPSIRAPLGLSDTEAEWLKKRRAKTLDPMRNLLGRLNIVGFDASDYINKVSSNGDFKDLPNIGIAFSGGGYRALTVGAGAFAAFDARTPGSQAPGHLGGLLQSATYVSGLSGGGWLVGSIYTNNFTSIDRSIERNTRGESSVFAFDRNIIEGPNTGTLGILRSVGYLKGLYDQVQEKRNAGYDTSITDYWGRGLAYQYIDAPDAGASYTFSSIGEQAGLVNGDIPLPILVSVGRAPGEKIISHNATVFEINPWEFGSYDPSTFGMAPTKYMGSEFLGGSLPNTAPCIAGFDNAGFVMATSSSLFNQVVLAIVSQRKESGLIGTLMGWLKDLANKFGNSENDIASWSPNPFYRYNLPANVGGTDKNLTLVDGGEDLQNVPLYPHIQLQRAVDVVFAIDSSADTITNGKNWPNGTALVASYERSKNAKVMNGTSFPAVPDVNSFVNLGLNARPTFFGCDVKNQSSLTPLIVYLPNTPYSYFSNMSTATTEFNNTVRNSMMTNGYEIATMGNGTLESEWTVCVGCAILSRSFDRTGTAMPRQCADCMSKHCWNGSRNSTEVSYNPPLGGRAAGSRGKVGVEPPRAETRKKNASIPESVVSRVLMALSLVAALVSWY